MLFYYRLFLCATILTACGCTNLIVPSKANKLPADLIQPCPQLQELTGTTGKHILPWAVQTVHTYNDCKARHEALVKAVMPPD